MPAPGEHHPAFEEYCECIFELHEDDVDVIQARIADRLSVSRPAVSEMIKRLEAEGLVASERGKIRLTAAGTELAERVVRRHRLAERFLTDILGLSWAEAHQRGRQVGARDVGRRRAGDGPRPRRPDHLPARQPDPGVRLPRPGRQPPGRRRASGTAFTVSRIPEELEFTPGLLEFLEASSIQPGHSGRVTAASPDGTMTVEIDGRHVGVGSFASARILVTA